MKSKKIAVLMHEALVPPEGVKLSRNEREKAEYRTEYDVVTTLRESGHEVVCLGVYDELSVIKRNLEEYKPHIVFNLLEEFNGNTLFDSHVVSYLELMKIPYTGAGPRGLMLARDKALAKKIMSYHRIKTPKFWVYPKSKKAKLKKSMEFPLIVKCLWEEASYGIAKGSVVTNEAKLLERIAYIHETLETDALVEQFVVGREMYVGIYGNDRPSALPVWELHFKNVDEPEKEIYSANAKFNEGYRKRKGIATAAAKLSPEEAIRIQSICKRAYKCLGLSGYARIDLRYTDKGEVMILEANPNPDISFDDEFALSAAAAGKSYSELLEKIMTLGFSWSKRFLI